MAVLAGEMDKCGDLLEKMQGMLQSFQKNLSQVSKSIQSGDFNSNGNENDNGKGNNNGNSRH